LITGVVSTFDEVTVDSPSFKSKKELGTGWAMLHQRCHRSASVNIPARCDDPDSPDRCEITPSESRGLD
jgi:hypothetical protein